MHHSLAARRGFPAVLCQPGLASWGGKESEGSLPQCNGPPPFFKWAHICEADVEERRVQRHLDGRAPFGQEGIRKNTLGVPVMLAGSGFPASCRSPSADMDGYLDYLPPSQ